MTSIHQPHFEDVPQTHQELLGLFTDRYLTLCKEMEAGYQEDLFSIAPLLFGKWYQTSLIENTLLSPANMFQLELPTLEDGIYAYVLHRTPNSDVLSFKLESYSTKEHPFVKDLRILTDFCTPAREMDEHLFFLEKDRPFLISQFSHQSEFYLEYLTRIAWWLGLFTILPSIHVKKIQQSGYCTIFWQKNIEEILKDIAGCACELAAERFSFSMDLETGIAQGRFFAEFLSKPQEIDRIFVEFYEQVDINITEIWKQGANMSEEDRALASSCIFTGIMLDKWFFYPMNQFLQFLSPISFMPLRYFYLVNNLAALVTMKRNIGAEIFSPPSYYTQTPLGQKLFPCESEPQAKFLFPKQGNFSELLEAVKAEHVKLQFSETFYANRTSHILCMRIAMGATPEYWKIIEMPDETSLDEFCGDILSAFRIEPLWDYVLSILDENDFPVEYSPKNSKRSLNKTTGRNLADLHLQIGDCFTLTPFSDKSQRLEVEIIGDKTGNPYVLYPRVSSQSEAVIAEEQVDELF